MESALFQYLRQAASVLRPVFSPIPRTPPMLNRRQIDTFKRRLQELARRHDADLTSLRNETARGVGGDAGGSLSDAPHHEADLGTAHHEEEIGLLLMENQERLLAECNAALARITAGTYGLCGRCAAEIPVARLDAFPEELERSDGLPVPAGEPGRP
jgi:RNA polymerase-binding transcription factor DksA